MIDHILLSYRFDSQTDLTNELNQINDSLSNDIRLVNVTENGWKLMKNLM